MKLGHAVALDGTKMQANASKHKAMSYGRMGEAEQKLQAEVEALLRHAEEVDEAEARQKAQEQKAEAKAKIAARQEQEKQTGQKPRGRAPQVPNPEQAKPESSAPRNFTDPESRIMPEGGVLRKKSVRRGMDSRESH